MVPSSKERPYLQPPERAEKFALLIVMAYGILIRLLNLGTQSIWLDEASSIANSQGSFTHILDSVARGEGSPPLYFLLLGLITSITKHEVAVRLLSVVAGVISIFLLYIFSRRLLGPTIALLAAALLSASPFALYYSQEARPYSLLMALSLASCYALLLATEKSCLRRWAAYSIFTAAMLYTHYFAIFLILGQGATILNNKRYRASLRYWLISQIVVIIAFSLWIPYLLFQFQWQSAQGGQTWVPRVGFWLVPYTLFQFSFGYSTVEIKQHSDLLSHAGILALGIVAFGVPLVASLKVIKERPTASYWALFLPAAAILFAIVFDFILHAYQPTYLSGVMPFYLLAVAYGIVFLARKPLFLVSPILVAFLTTFSLWNYFTNPQFAKEDWRRAANYVALQATSEDIIVFHKSYPRLAFDYYFSSDVSEFSLPDRALPEDSENISRVKSTLINRPTIWLVVSHNFDTGDYYREMFSDWFSFESCKQITTCRTIEICKFSNESFDLVRSIKSSNDMSDITIEASKDD